jgi:hypothetical protein
MLNLRLLRGPLSPEQKERIRTEYNRLASTRVPPENLQRWVEDSPAGPALHALLETDDSVIVGHCCLFPFPMDSSGTRLTVAKAEYFFVGENYRSERVRGLESPKPAALLLLEQLYRRGLQEGWGPLIISAPAQIQPLHKMAGCRLARIPLRECLFVVRPWRSSIATPNLTRAHRAAMFGVGVAQQALWFALSHSMARLEPARPTPIPAALEQEPCPESQSLSLSEAPDFLSWRYPASEYFRVGFGRGDRSYAVLKRGSDGTYLRVCQSRIAPGDSCGALLATLIREARREEALGVRWAIYENGCSASELVRSMRRLGFVSSPRVRNIWLYSSNEQLLRPEVWHLSDSLFAFDN